MLRNTLRKINKNIFAMLVMFAAVWGCDSGNETEDLALRIQVNKNHIELSNFTSCVDEISYVETKSYQPNGEQVVKIFCEYDSSARPVEQTTFIYHDEERLAPNFEGPDFVYIYEWSADSSKLIIKHYQQIVDGQAEYRNTEDCITPALCLGTVREVGF